MTEENNGNIHTDEDGIPMLYDVVRPGRRVNEMEPEEMIKVQAQAMPKIKTADGVEFDPTVFMNTPEMQALIAEIAADLDNEVTWKLEKVLKTAIQDTVHQCIDAMSASVHKSVVTHLNLMMPVLMDMVQEQIVEESKEAEAAKPN